MKTQGGNGALFDRNQFDLEDEGGERRDGAIAVLAVSEVVGDAEFVGRAYGHQLQGFGPAFDDLRYAESGCLSALVPSMSLPS